MIQVTLKGEKVGVDFSYEDRFTYARFFQLPLEQVERLVGGGTFTHKTPRVIAAAIVRRGTANHHRAKGRKYAFRSLLTQMGVPRPDRAEMWRELFAQIRMI